MNYDVIVIGGGAAGLMAAGVAAKAGGTVLVAEKMNRPARKILVTGKGRCNLTNNCDLDTLMSNVRTNPRFLYSSFHGFTPQDTMSLFESLGVKLKTERGNRVFPQSDSGKDIADALVRFVKQGGGEIKQFEIKNLLIANGQIKGAVTQGGEEILAPRVIVATGGKSYSGTGSTGDGYRFATEAGHTITPLSPSLVGMDTKESWIRELAGLSLRNVEVSLYKVGGKKPLFKERGEMLFTHKGVSGPLILSASSYIKKGVAQHYLSVDLKPALDIQQLDNRLLRDFQEFENRDYANALDNLLPKSLIPVIIKLSSIPPTQKVHQITKEQRTTLLQLLKGLTIGIESLEPIERAVITSGGVKVGEVDPKTMESKLVKGLYFAGEVLDLDAYTGGFNLQIAFSTGYSGGCAAGEREEKE